MFAIVKIKLTFAGIYYHQRRKVKVESTLLLQGTYRTKHANNFNLPEPKIVLSFSLISHVWRNWDCNGKFSINCRLQQFKILSVFCQRKSL